MKNIILCSNLYNDAESLSNLIGTMEYEDNLYGQEIKDFNFIPQGLDQQFTMYLNEQVEIQPNTGVFRKPSKLIHCEQFYQHCLWIGIVALENTVLRLHEQETIKTVFDVENMDTFFVENCNDESKWQTTNSINIKKNDFVFIRPWLWHSLEEGKLVQIFLLNHKIENKQEEQVDGG